MYRLIAKSLLKASFVLAFSVASLASAQDATPQQTQTADEQTQSSTDEKPQTIVVLQSAILTVDNDRLFKGSMFGQRVQAEFQDDRAALIAENRTKEAELAAEEKDLTDRRPTLDRDEFSKLADEFDTKAQAIRKEQAAKEAEIRAKPERARQEFLRTVQDVLVEIMRERRALAVFTIDAVFLHADSINITDEAISRIDALIGDGKNN